MDYFPHIPFPMPLEEGIENEQDPYPERSPQEERENDVCYISLL